MAGRSCLRVFILVFLAVLFLPACAGQQLAQPSSLDEFALQLDILLPELLQKYRVPGVAVALVQDGQLAWTKGYGLANEEAAIPVTAQTVFQTASISKSITAWGVMRLVEAGKIDLDAPVDDYLAHWHLPASEFDLNGVTVRRLLSHTAGIVAWNNPGIPVDQTPPTTLDLLSGVHVDHQPGEREKYSNAGYIILQLLIEDVSGQPFANYMQSQVLTPLGMEHSTYQWSPKLGAAMASGYQLPGRPVVQRIYPAAAGGLYSTTSDLGTWLAAGMGAPNGHSAGRNVLQTQTVAEMYTTELAAQKNGNGLGYVVENLPSGRRMLLHSGEIPGCGTTRPCSMAA